MKRSSIRITLLALLLCGCTHARANETSPPVVREVALDEEQESQSSDAQTPGSANRASAVERATKPIANWVEEKLQKSSLLQPSTYSRERVESPAGERTLREAILIARGEFDGSVLSAKRMSEGDQSWYRIKILSDAGVLRLIDVDTDIDAMTSQQQEPPVKDTP